jgi:DNA invertase Pin-like site-specific DNA recombinase
MQAAIYVRCSAATKKNFADVSAYLQAPEAQVKALPELVESRGWELSRVYSDRMSGSKGARPGLNALMEDARRGLFGVVLVLRFDRFADSVKQLVLALEEFRALGIEFISHHEALDTSTPMGKAMSTIIVAMADLERPRYSSRSALTGFTSEARRTGPNVPISVTTRIRNGSTTKASGST